MFCTSPCRIAAGNVRRSVSTRRDSRPQTNAHSTDESLVRETVRMKRRSTEPQRRRAIRGGTVALLSAEQGRYTVAQQCFDALDLPRGTVRVRYAGRSNVA